MENQVAISGSFNREQANLVENSVVQPNYTADLMALAEQIQNVQFLQEQARGILEKAKVEKELHQAACNVLKRPGTCYYYYERESGQRYMTIMSPSDWGSKCPHTFLGAYRLEYDNSWTSLDKIQHVDERKALITQVMSKPALASIKDVI